MPDPDNKTSPSTAPGQWTWGVSILALCVFLDVLAIIWYLVALPDALYQQWEKVASGVLSGIAAVLTYFGAKYTYGEVTSWADFLRYRPLVLIIIVYTAIVWSLVLPVHQLTITVNGPDSKEPLRGVKVRVDSEKSPRPMRYDTEGRVKISGLQASSHEMHFEKDGYQPEDSTAGFMDVLTFARLEVMLERPKIQIEFKTTPEGAEIYLDGDDKNPRGRTTQSLLLTPERHSVMFKRGPNYKPTAWVEVKWKEIPVVDGKRTVVGALEKKPVRTYSVTISSDPPGAQVHIAGKLHGTTNPTLTVQLAAGRHLIKFKKSGYEIYPTAVTVPDENVVTARLKKEGSGP